ncbi:MAG: GNAT family N-acetyltransferase [Adhaeribacter sp.]
MQVIQGKRVTLRPAKPEDRRQIYQMLAQSDLTVCMLGAPLFPVAEIPTWEYFVEDYNLSFFSDLNPDYGRSFIIEVNADPIGHINYNQIDRVTNTVELDIWLKSSAYCNQGYGSDAINTLCNFLNRQLYCQSIILAPPARNQAAVRAYTKCGFVPTQAPPGNFIPDYPDAVVMIKQMTPPSRQAL